MKPCFDPVTKHHSDTVTKHHSDTSIFLRGLSTSSRKFVTPSMCLTLSQNSPDETCCFLKRLVFFKQQICDNVCAVYMPALHASDQQEQSTYLPQTRRIFMLQAAAARLTVPLQRIRCMTCRYQHHCHLIAPCEYVQAHRQQAGQTSRCLVC